MISKVHKIFDENYNDCIKTVTILSFDDNNKESLCTSEKKFLGYDNIVRRFNNESLCSSDIIHIKNDRVIFIEFKNGCIKDPKEKMRIKLKGVEGGFICLFEILNKNNKSISFDDVIKLPKEYIIVYNGQKNISRTSRILSHLEALNLRFGLEKYKGTFFNNIQTVTEDIFMNSIINDL